MEADAKVAVGDVLYHARYGPGKVARLNVGGAGAVLRFLDMVARSLPLTSLSRRPFPTDDTTAGGPVEIEIVTASNFAGRTPPKREFMDEASLIPCRNVTLLTGDGGTGKSLLALQLACGVAMTEQWIGMRVRLGSVLYFSAEDDEAETHIRLSEISTSDGFDLANLSGLRIALMAGKEAVLANENVRSASMVFTPLFDRLRAEIEDSRPHLLVLDNLADIFAGNENVKTLARQFVGRLRGLAIEFDLAILLLSHPSLSGMASGAGTSGNTAWSNSVRSRLYFHRDIQKEGNTEGVELDPNKRWLDTKKSNYGPTGGAIGLQWQGGRFIRIDQPTTSGAFDAMAKVMKAERVFMDLLRWHERHNKHVSPSVSSVWAPTVFAKHSQSEGVKRNQFERAMEVLLDRGEIHIRMDGPPSKPRPRIAIGPHPDRRDEGFQHEAEAAE